MKSALKLVAFARGNRADGIVALLEIALEALDKAGYAQAALSVDLALNQCVAALKAEDAAEFDEIQPLQ